MGVAPLLSVITAGATVVGQAYTANQQAGHMKRAAASAAKAAQDAVAEQQRAVNKANAGSPTWPASCSATSRAWRTPA